MRRLRIGELDLEHAGRVRDRDRSNERRVLAAHAQRGGRPASQPRLELREPDRLAVEEELRRRGVSPHDERGGRERAPWRGVAFGARELDGDRCLARGARRDEREGEAEERAREHVEEVDAVAERGAGGAHADGTPLALGSRRASGLAAPTSLAFGSLRASGLAGARASLAFGSLRASLALGYGAASWRSLAHTPTRAIPKPTYELRSAVPRKWTSSPGSSAAAPDPAKAWTMPLIVPSMPRRRQDSIAGSSHAAADGAGSAAAGAASRSTARPTIAIPKRACGTTTKPTASMATPTPASAPPASAPGPAAPSTTASGAPASPASASATALPRIVRGLALAEDVLQ